jgi:hypothetical protein
MDAPLQEIHHMDPTQLRDYFRDMAEWATHEKEANTVSKDYSGRSFMAGVSSGFRSAADAIDTFLIRNHERTTNGNLA